MDFEIRKCGQDCCSYLGNKKGICVDRMLYDKGRMARGRGRG
jgi:hypothetical protein